MIGIASKVVPLVTGLLFRHHSGRLRTCRFLFEKARLMSQAMTSAATRPTVFLGREALIRIVDGLPETQGLGIVSIERSMVTRVRGENGSGATVVFELRSPASVRTGDPAPSHRGASTSPAMEWVSLGFNCGGAVLAWIGVAGASSLAPVTGGLSFGAAALLYGGAVATTGQCMVSGYRTANVMRDRTDLNDRLDNSKLYSFTMSAADGIGILGGLGAIKELRAVNAALEEGGVGWGMATSGKLSRPLRRRLTTALELQGGRRASAVVIDQLVRQRLLDAVAGAIGMVGSGVNGVLKDVVVWMTSEAGSLGSGR